MSETTHLYRALPSIDTLFKALSEQKVIIAEQSCTQTENADIFNVGNLGIPRALLRQLLNEYLERCRSAIRNKLITNSDELDLAKLLPKIEVWIKDHGRPHFRRVLNATGVVIHTNLGRSLLAKEAVQAVSDACANYSNLEFDLHSGERGSRYNHVEDLICNLTGAEAALVVNNNAAAVLLVLDTLCKGREVVVSRGQLVEVGGSFRIPEVMEKSGCILKEVGATNRVHVEDYRKAINDNTAALMRVHTSNYRIAGFHSAVSLPALVELAKGFQLPVIEDLGSGNLCDFSAAGIPLLANEEPTAQAIIADGADIVTFSGDKVLGGPQAGIIAGRTEYIRQIKKNQLNRALRIDKMTLAALEATLRLYTEPELARRKIPTLRMLCFTPDELKTRATRLSRRLNKSLKGIASCAICSGQSLAGGGSFPEKYLPTTLVKIITEKMDAATMRKKLMHTSPPMVGRIEDDFLCLDVRTLNDEEFSLAEAALLQVLKPK